jgi:hypothetical protein
VGTRIQLLALVASVLVIVFIVGLIRQRKLREEYSIMWFIASLVLVIFAAWRNLLDLIASLVGVYYAPAVLLLVGLFFGVLMFLHVTVIISKHSNQTKALSQKIALLEERLERFRKDEYGGADDQQG